jgi:hypothetical protein
MRGIIILPDRASAPRNLIDNFFRDLRIKTVNLFFISAVRERYIELLHMVFERAICQFMNTVLGLHVHFKPDPVHQYISQRRRWDLVNLRDTDRPAYSRNRWWMTSDEFLDMYDENAVE